MPSADKPTPMATPAYRVHQRLHQELRLTRFAASSKALVVTARSAMADQTDDATAQPLALQQHEEHERE